MMAFNIVGQILSSSDLLIKKKKIWSGSKDKTFVQSIKLLHRQPKGRESRHVSTMAFLIKNGRISLKSFVGGACIVFVPWISHLGSSLQYLYTDFWLYLLLLYIILYNGGLVLFSFITTGGIQSEFCKVFCILNSENKQYSKKNHQHNQTRKSIRDAFNFHLSNTHLNSCSAM